MSAGYSLGFSRGFIIVRYIQLLILVPSLVGRVGEVVVLVRGFNRHVESKAMLCLPSIAYSYQVLSVKALAVILFYLEFIPYQLFCSS